MRYTLEKYSGSRSRYTCPKCGRRGQFTRYIDLETGCYVGDNVGICNRRDKCGYHLTPWQAKPLVALDYEPRLRVKKSNKPQLYTPPVEVVTPSASEICTIDPKIMQHSLSLPPSPYMVWLESIVGADVAGVIKRLYNIGSTEDGRTVFWQVDAQNRVRTGKVMRYDPATGKRIRDGTKGNCDWMHSILKREGILSNDWTLTQCLYGENLTALNLDTTFPIAIVESYKTAHICASLLTDYIWTSVDNINGLTAQRLSALAGRKVVLFPDAGAGHKLWSERSATLAREVGCTVKVSDWLLTKATPEMLADGADIADALLGG